MTDEYMGGADMPVDAGQAQPQVPEGSAEPAASELITKQEFAKFTADLTEELRRMIQSQTGKTESRIKKDVDEKLSQVEANFKSLREAGYPVTDEDLKAARSQALRETMTSLASDDSAAKRNQPAADPQQQAVIKQTNDAMRNLQKQYGYVLTENDPEFWDVPFTGSQPDEFLQKYEAGLREVVSRLGRPVPQQVTAPIGSPAARVPSPGGSATGGSIEALTTELGKLLNKGNLTPTEDRRRKELEAELLKQVPRR